MSSLATLSIVLFAFKLHWKWKFLHFCAVSTMALKSDLSWLSNWSILKWKIKWYIILTYWFSKKIYIKYNHGFVKFAKKSQSSPRTISLVDSSLAPSPSPKSSGRSFLAPRGCKRAPGNFYSTTFFLRSYRWWVVGTILPAIFYKTVCFDQCSEPGGKVP